MSQNLLVFTGTQGAPDEGAPITWFAAALRLAEVALKGAGVNKPVLADMVDYHLFAFFQPPRDLKSSKKAKSFDLNGFKGMTGGVRVAGAPGVEVAGLRRGESMRVDDSAGALFVWVNQIGEIGHKSFSRSHLHEAERFEPPIIVPLDGLTPLQTQAMKWLMHGERGMSSETMCRLIAGVGPVTREKVFPSDGDDFSRCAKFLEAVPLAREKLDCMRVNRTWTAYVDHWDELERLYKKEVSSGKSAGLGARLKELHAEATAPELRSRELRAQP